MGDVNSISTAIVQKIDALERVGERLKYLTSHDSLVVLHNSLTIPKLQYLLHTSPCFMSSTLQHYDNVLRSIVSSVVNIHIYSEDPSWTQAILPVDLGGLGISSAVSIAPYAFLALPRPLHTALQHTTIST